jgi:ABC-type glycerol-3-phosphate transport system substrate-binding protein
LKAAGVTTDPEKLATWTWQDFTDAAVELTKMDGDQVSQSGFMVPKPDAASLSVWASCHGTSFYAKNPDGVEIGVGFNDKDAAVNGLNWTLDMLNKAKVSKPITPDRQDWQEFMQGAAAMAVSGPWSYGQLRTDLPDLNWFTMLFPAAPVEGGKQGTAVWNNMLVIPTKSKNKDAGWSFLEFWCSLDWMKERLAIGDWLAPRKDFYESTEYKAKFDKLPVLGMVPKASAAGTPLVFIQQSALDATIQPILEAIILGKEPVESGVEKLVTQCNEVLAKAGYA